MLIACIEYANDSHTNQQNRTIYVQVMEVVPMEKWKVIHAYRRGMISLQECAQILGVDSMQVMGIMKEHVVADLVPRIRNKQPVG